MRKTIVENIDLIAFHPGQYIGELIEDYTMTQKEFAEKLGLSPKTISKLVNGEESISNDLAQKLEKLTNISMKTWLNLQAFYDRKVAEGAVPRE
ncbi:HigA family addiction module antidote protein [Streptococcus oralis]|jgi:addiction module antidote protein HigA|uniref:Putative HTH-type transcriptional regulator YddM n=1 Tax=Streptococcus oralis TaxID=1303 RepID=A0A6N3ANN2_STROR